MDFVDTQAALGLKSAYNMLRLINSSQSFWALALVVIHKLSTIIGYVKILEVWAQDTDEDRHKHFYLLT